MPPAASAAPMETALAGEDATGAALKAIQAIEATAVGASTFPRSGDMTYPEFFMSALHPMQALHRRMSFRGHQ